jgi:hypothetical protein
MCATPLGHFSLLLSRETKTRSRKDPIFYSIWPTRFSSFESCLGFKNRIFVCQRCSSHGRKLTLKKKNFFSEFCLTGGGEWWKPACPAWSSVTGWFGKEISKLILNLNKELYLSQK